MYPARFRYEAPRSLAEAITLLRDGGDYAKVLAGGQSLVPMMKLRFASPDLLVDINNIPGLSYLRADPDGSLHVGALCRHADLEWAQLLKDTQPTMAAAAPVIADPIVRNRGTVGGSLCQADPSEDLSAVFAALRGVAVIQGIEGRRSVDLREFHSGPYETAVGDGDILIEVRVPIRTNTGSAYEKVERRAGDWSVAAAGAFVRLDANGTIEDVGIGLTAVGAEQFTCPEAEDRLRGSVPTEDAIQEAGRICSERCNPSADQRGPVDYKRHLVGVLVGRALNRSIARARGEAA